MKTRALFELAVRLLGLVFLYHGLIGLPSTLPLLIGAFMTMNPAGLAVALFALVWPFAVAWWLLGGAPLLVQRACPGASGDTGSDATLHPTRHSDSPR